MASSDQHLILIRGNSASGKTSLARELQVAMGRGTANIGQDHFRRVVLREHDVPGGDNVELIALAARHCLKIGYHVILEGILFSQHYGDMLRTLLDEHPGPRHVLYLDVPLDEAGVDSSRLDALNARLLERLRRETPYAPSPARPHGAFAIRPVFLNARTRDADVEGLYASVLRLGRELAAS